MVARVLIASWVVLFAGSWRTVGADAAAPASADTSAAMPTAGEVYELGRTLFDQLAPPELKAQFEFPTKEQWDGFALRLQQALEGDSLADLAAFSGEARVALSALSSLEGYEDLADWLVQRLDEIDGAAHSLQPTKPAVPQPPTRPGAPLPAVQPVPNYNLWLARVQHRPIPSRAPALVRRLEPVFRSEGIPAELLWLAEAESSFNPGARSPAGARGLFQLMPETARALGLRTFLPDERTDPEQSARAAARYLRTLHGRFGNWALALAAYNAGEGRIARTLAARRANTFTAIADALPAETRMYVPKVCALIAARTGVTPDRIAPPRAK